VRLLFAFFGINECNGDLSPIYDLLEDSSCLPPVEARTGNRNRCVVFLHPENQLDNQDRWESRRFEEVLMNGLDIPGKGPVPKLPKVDAVNPADPYQRPGWNLPRAKGMTFVVR